MKIFGKTRACRDDLKGVDIDWWFYKGLLGIPPKPDPKIKKLSKEQQESILSLVSMIESNSSKNKGTSHILACPKGKK